MEGMRSTIDTVSAVQWQPEPQPCVEILSPAQPSSAQGRLRQWNFVNFVQLVLLLYIKIKDIENILSPLSPFDSFLPCCSMARESHLLSCTILIHLFAS